MGQAQKPETQRTYHQDIFFPWRSHAEAEVPVILALFDLFNELDVLLFLVVLDWILNHQ